VNATVARLLLVLLLLLPAVPLAQNAWVADWLRDYAAGKHAEVAERLQKVASISRLEADLEIISKNWLKQEPADARRRELAAFALEAGFAQAVQGPAAGKLVEWGCRQIRRVTKPGDFEQRWHLAAFAVLGGAIDPENLEKHVTHMKFQFPNEPRLAFERALASELSAADVFTRRKAPPGDVAEKNAEAAKRYREASASPDSAVQAESWLRLGRVELARGRLDEAMSALDQAEPMLSDPAMKYLARLFRGMTLERLKQTDAARQAYQAALTLNPGAHAATTALASLLFRAGERAEADKLMSALVARTQPVIDPWWFYWPGDYRFGTARIQAVRAALR
jgi:tetratricopeptide (TPR) repeat protein